MTIDQHTGDTVVRTRAALTVATWILAFLLGSEAASAQGLNIDLSAGVVAPVKPSNQALTTGAQVAVGVSKWLSGPPVAVGLEASFIWFGNQVDPQVPDHVRMANLLVTSRYRFGSRAIRPYIGIAAGIAQNRASETSVMGGNGELNGAGRATLGVEARIRGSTAALEGGYAGVATQKYRGNFIRYVPLSVRISF